MACGFGDGADRGLGGDVVGDPASAPAFSDREFLSLFGDQDAADVRPPADGASGEMELASLFVAQHFVCSVYSWVEV